MSFNYVPGQTVTVPEIEYKQTVKLAAGKTAVVVVDMQNDFVKPDGTLVVESAAGTIPNIRALLNAARSAKIPIAYTQDTHFDGDPEWENTGAQQMTPKTATNAKNRTGKIDSKKPAFAG